jgi:hypothetical protein
VGVKAKVNFYGDLNVKGSATGNPGFLYGENNSDINKFTGSGLWLDAKTLAGTGSSAEGPGPAGRWLEGN